MFSRIQIEFSNVFLTRFYTMISFPDLCWNLQKQILGYRPQGDVYKLVKFLRPAFGSISRTTKLVNALLRTKSVDMYNVLVHLTPEGSIKICVKSFDVMGDLHIRMIARFDPEIQWGHNEGIWGCKLSYTDDDMIVYIYADIGLYV